MFESCLIRAVVLTDLPMLLAWRNHEDVRRFMFTQHAISPQEHRHWFDRVSVDPTRRLLLVEEDSVPLGFVQLSNVAPGGVADWGFYARPNAPKGSGRKLGHMALNHAFGELNLHKVCGQAIASNTASISFHQKLGFVQEGVLRDQQCIGGVYHSLICFGLLAHEWQPGHGVQEITDDKN